MGILDRLLGRPNRDFALLREKKPLDVNLGGLAPMMLEMVANGGRASPVMIQREGVGGINGMVTTELTPAHARKALEAKERERRAEALFRGGKFREAVRAFQDAISIAPYEDEILFMSLGATLSELRDYERARQAYEIAIDINPGSERVARNFALMKREAGMD